MRDALDDPGAAVVMLDLAPEGEVSRTLLDEVALETMRGPAPLVVAHVSGTDGHAVPRAEARLARGGAIMAGSDAAIARLAGIVVVGGGSID